MLFQFRHDAQPVGNAVHEIEIGDDDHDIENVLIGKACGPQTLHIHHGYFTRSVVQLPSEAEQGTVFFFQRYQCPLILLQGGDQSVIVRNSAEKLPVRYESVVAAVPGRHGSGQHFFPAATKCSPTESC